MQITSAKKIEASKGGLRAWHNKAIQYPENYSLTFEQLIHKIDTENPTWRENFGASYIIAEEYLGTAAVENAMAALADRNEGKATTYPNGEWRGAEFNDALYGKVSGWNVDKITVVAKGVASDVVDKVDSTAKMFLGVSTAYIAIAGLLAILVFAHSAGKSAKV